MGTLFNDISSRHFASQIGQGDYEERLGVLDALIARRDSDLLLGKAVELLADDHASVRSRAAEAIGAVGTKDAARAVIESWEEFGPDALDAAVDALAQIGREAVFHVRKQLTHTNPSMRAAAVTALGRLDAKTVVTDLATALGDRDIAVVCAAARAIGRHQASKCLDDLSVIFRRKPGARIAIIEAWEHIGTPAALKQLYRASHTADSDVADAARAAIQRIEHTGN